MASSYHLTVKKYFEQNKIDCALPEYIQRGWNRIYTPEEQEFLRRPCIIGPDVQIPNSVVRRRLGTTQMLRKANLETLRKAFELPEELFMKLSGEHQHPEIIKEENLLFKWDDDEDNVERKRKKSPIDELVDKQREKRRKYEDYKYDYDTLEPLTIEEIVEEIRTNIGQDLKSEDIKLITELMQIISGSKNDQIMNIYDELTNVQLIDKFGAVPKLVQTLQEIQKTFEQVAMKTNVASIETVLDILREKDKTYRVAVELLNSFNENTKKNKLHQVLNLNDKSGDISDYDHTVFNILLKDRISRLPATDVTMLISDLGTIRHVETKKLNQDRDEQVKFLSEQLNIIFTRAHLDGIKTAFNTMKSPVSVAVKEFIDKIENSLKTKLTESDHIVIESYIHDHLTLLNDNEVKTVYERLAQQGTVKRLTGFSDSNQAITMGLMKKIETDGLGIVIENIKEAHLEMNVMNELTQALTHINHHLQTPSSVSLEQIQKQLDMAYFIETRNLRQQDIHELSKAVNLYSIAQISLPEEATNEQCSTFLEYLKAPFIRKCIQRMLNTVYQENTIDLNKVSNKFYNQQIVDLINELIHGSDELNGNLLFHQIKEQLKKTKELPEKLYRQMFKEKLIPLDTKTKIDTDKKKVVVITNRINTILNNEKDPKQQKQLMELFERIDVPLPERIKHWYENKSNTPNLPSASPKTKKDTLRQKDTVKTKSKIPTDKPERMTQKTNDRLPNTAVITTSKRDSEQKGSLPKSRPKTQTTVRQEKLPSKTLDTTKKEKTNANSQSKDQRKSTLQTYVGHPSTSPSKTITTTSKAEASNIDHVSELQKAREDGFIAFDSPQTQEETSEYIDPLLPKQEQVEEENHEHFSDLPSSNTPNKSIESNQNITSSQDTETQIKKDSDESPQAEDNHEPNVEIDDQFSASQKIIMFQADLETIQPKTTTDGQMGEDKLFHFEPEQAAACLVYHPSLPSNPARELNTKLSGKTAQVISDLPYEKTKAQRILAKAVPASASHSHFPGDTMGTKSSSTTLPASNLEASSITPASGKLPIQPTDEPSAKLPRRSLNKSLKQTDDYYINSLTKLLNNLFTQSKYNSLKLRKIHEELIASGHISPLNEFYRSTNEALRVTLDHCVTYDELIKWTLSLLQTTNKPNLTDFGHDLYSIAIDLDSTLTERIDNARCAMEIQQSLKHQLHTISESDLRGILSNLINTHSKLTFVEEINSYINAAQLEKIINLPKKVNVSSKDRMISDLNSFLLHLIQACHTFDLKYRPMQTRIREISETFKSVAVADLARKLDEIEKHLSKTFGVTLFSLSRRMNESRFLLIK